MTKPVVYPGPTVMVPALHKHLNAFLCCNPAAAISNSSTSGTSDSQQQSRCCYCGWEYVVPDVLLLLQPVQVSRAGGTSNAFAQAGRLSYAGQLLYAGQFFSVCRLCCVQAGMDADGHPRVMGLPVKELKGDFPLRPECMGNLVPQQVNLWMGAAPNGQLRYIPCHSLLD